MKGPEGRGRFPSVTTYRAFGLTLRADFRLPGMSPVEASDSPDVEIELVEERVIDREWSGPSGEPDAVGTMHGGLFRVTHGVGADHRLVYGDKATFHVSPGARRILCAPLATADLWWQRELLDTVLWLSALEHGYEGLHAGAVERPEGVVAVVAGSGGGKSSLTAALVRAGARFFSDDVLALERMDGGVRAHPGPPLMNLPAHWAVDPDLPALGESIARFEQEEWVSVHRPSRDARPLAAVVLLERGTTQDLSVESAVITPLDLRHHLFIHPFLAGRERERFLIAADLLATVPVLRLRAAADEPPAQLAEAVAASVGALMPSQASGVA